MMKVSTVDHGTTMVHNWPFVSQIIHHDGFVQYSSWSQMYTNLSLPIYRSAGMHCLCVQPNFQQTKVFHHIRIPHSEILHIVVQQCAEIASEPVNTYRDSFQERLFWIHNSEFFRNLILEESEEDVERNDNICRQTDNQVNKQSLNSKTEAHSNPLWIVGERAN